MTILVFDELFYSEDKTTFLGLYSTIFDEAKLGNC